MKTCGLCLKPVVELCDSHLLPKSVYKTVRKIDGINDNLVMADSHTGKSYFSDKQVTAYFLCESCEDLFNKNGERTVIGECYKSKRQFSLLEKIKKANVLFTTKVREKYILPEKNNIEYEKYKYFASSVFWRSSAWPNKESQGQNSLGEKYQEQFRLYLSEETSFPPNAYLFVFVDRSKDLIPYFTFPTTKKHDGYHTHIFNIPGVKFQMMLGGHLGKFNKLLQLTESNTFFIERQFTRSEEYFSVIQSVKALQRAGKLAQGK